jgi:hypothetical protein
MDEGQERELPDLGIAADEQDCGDSLGTEPEEIGANHHLVPR